MTETTSGNSIELRVENISQLFHTLDPFPFRERDPLARKRDLYRRLAGATVELKPYIAATSSEP